MRFPHGFTATVERAAKADRYGNRHGTTTHTIARCARERVSSVDTIDGALVVTTRERLWCDDPDADLRADDVVILPDGTRWQVDGDVDRPDSPYTGWRPGLSCHLVRAAGGTAPQE